MLYKLTNSLNLNYQTLILTRKKNTNLVYLWLSFIVKIRLISLPGSHLIRLILNKTTFRRHGGYGQIHSGAAVLTLPFEVGSARPL